MSFSNVFIGYKRPPEHTMNNITTTRVDLSSSFTCMVMLDFSLFQVNTNHVKIPGKKIRSFKPFNLDGRPLFCKRNIIAE